ncbi:MAG: CDP-glycerol glycerophosphotransferase family protein [Treponema sp.]|nr:CDP-glycerol glycerophosphotransferase family protein [Treponema sp.]
MIFSILIGAAATVYFLARALIIKIRIALSGGRAPVNRDLVHPCVIYSEGKQYWDVFKPVLDEFECRRKDLLFLTSSEDDPVFCAGYNFIKAEYIGEGNKAFARLNILQADFCLMTTPGLDVYQLKRSKMVKHYSHVLHAPSDATMYRLFGIDYFDSILLTGDYQARDIRILEEQRGIRKKMLVTVGCTYLDVYSARIKEIPKEEKRGFTVLVSPSWGPSALLSRYGEKLLSPLAKTGWRIIIRPHPQSKKSEASMLDSLGAKYRNAANIEWDFDRENIYSLIKADIMISDFSGIIYDYAFLCDKPVVYVKQGIDIRVYDADDLGKGRISDLWQFKTLSKIGIELKEEHFDRIEEVIRNTVDSTELRQARKKSRDEAWQYRGEAGRRIASFMIETAGI